MWSANEWHYYVIERHLGPWWRGLRRRWAALTGRVQTWREAWALRHGPLQEETRMTDVETPTIAPAALGRVLLSRLDPEAVAAIKAAVTEELLGLVKDEAVHEARQRLQEDFNDQRERLYDTLAQEKRQIEADTNARFEAEVEAALADERQEWADQRDALRTKARTALARAQAAEACVVQLITELCGGLDQRETYLYSGGYGVRTLDKGVVNHILATAGAQLKSRATVSERKVAVTLEDGRTVEHVLFKVAKTTPAGVLDPDDEDDAGTT